MVTVEAVRHLLLQEAVLRHPLQDHNHEDCTDFPMTVMVTKFLKFGYYVATSARASATLTATPA